MEVEEQDWSMFLPENMLLEILARLPVKSLLRFRSVAKSWRDMVKDPYFITKHHHTQVALNNGNCVLARNLIGNKLKFALLTKDEQGIKCNSLKLQFPPESPYCMDDVWNIKIAGPCNGIVAMSIGSDLILWNPATREYKALPPASLSSSWSGKLRRGCCTFGFGIDPITKDYKVVRLWNFRDRESPNIDIIKAEVFSLSANSCRPKGEVWKVIDDEAPAFVLAYADVAYLNGKYYWCLYDPYAKEEEQIKIVWFDMGAEVFGLIEVPINVRREIDQYSFTWYMFTVFKGSCLAMVTRARQVENKHMYHIWIIGEGGLSWTNYATVGPFLDDEIPFGFWKNEELVVYNYSMELMYESYLYNIKIHVKKKMTQGVRYDKSLPPAIYNENLVSFED